MMLRTILCLLLCLPCAQVLAQDAPSCNSGRSCMTEGIHAMVEGDHDLAIRAFQRGHVRKPDPSFLYHIALCHGRSGRLTSAIEFIDWTLSYSLPHVLRRKAHARRAAYIISLRARTLIQTTPASPERAPTPSTTRLNIDDFDIPERRSPRG